MILRKYAFVMNLFWTILTKKNVSRVCKKTFYIKFIIRLLNGLKGVTLRNLQIRPKVPKKLTPNQPAAQKSSQKKYV
jgi:hypothetical protein